MLKSTNSKRSSKLRSGPKPSHPKAKKIAASAGAAPRLRENTKQAKVMTLLRRPSGATIADLAKATGWQPHTVRGAISGALKKKFGLKVTSEKAKDGERVYRIVG